jgi:hypothetical protein
VTLTANQVAQFKATHAALMADTCQIGTYSSSTVDAHGQPVESWSYATAIPCGCDISQTQAKQQPSSEVNPVAIDGSVRLPLTASVTTRDRIKVTKMAGVALGTALVLEVVGAPRLSHAAQLIDVRWADL